MGMDHTRKGPPRPSVDRGGHPTNFERPYVHRTNEDKSRRRHELKEEATSKGLLIKSAEWEDRFGRPYPLSDEEKALIEKHWGRR